MSWQRPDGWYVSDREHAAVDARLIDRLVRASKTSGASFDLNILLDSDIGASPAQELRAAASRYEGALLRGSKMKVVVQQQIYGFPIGCSHPAG